MYTTAVRQHAYYELNHSKRLDDGHNIAPQTMHSACCNKQVSKSSYSFLDATLLHVTLFNRTAVSTATCRCILKGTNKFHVA